MEARFFCAGFRQEDANATHISPETERSVLIHQPTILIIGDRTMQRSNYLVAFVCVALCLFPMLEAGAQWAVQYGAVRLYSVSIASPTTAWVCGNPGTIFKTTNGGATWVSQTSGTSAQLNSIYFTDANTGWAVGDSGLVLKTTNGGSAWLRQTSGTSLFLNRVQFLNTNTGWALSRYNTILRTTNGGTSWQSTNTGGAYEKAGMSFVSSTAGWISGDHNQILKTTDGGFTWAPQSNPFSDSTGVLTSIHFVDVNRGWAVGGDYVGRHQRIVATTNGGSSWIVQRNTFGGHLMSVFFLNATTGFAAGWEGAILRTTNGGTTWLDDRMGIEVTFYEGKAVSGAAWIVGAENNIILNPTIVGVSDENPGQPQLFVLSQNYPNPFNPSTIIEYQLPTRGNIQINIYNSIGQLVKTLVDGKTEEAGNHTITWDGRNDAGSPVSSGTYFYQIRIDDQVQAKKMILLK